MAQDQSSLQDELREKEQLVAALTERLEQAAEQLDRIHRTGADRIHRTGSSGGLPSELIENQQALTDDLQRAVEDWEEMQPSATLERIETQIGELRGLIEGRMESGSLGAGSSVAHDISPTAYESIESGAGSNGSSMDSDAESLSTYEAYKSGLFDSPVDEDSDTQPESESEAAAQEDGETESYNPPPLVVEEIAEVDAPAEIDVPNADVEELRHAVDERDAYITYLIRKLRNAEIISRNPVQWDSLENAPEDLKAHLMQLETQLDDALRLAEVEQSVERARLSREALRLSQLEEQLNQAMKKQGLAEGNGSDEDAEEQGGMNGRWQRLFGK
jgi:hypothetical protein